LVDLIAQPFNPVINIINDPILLNLNLNHLIFVLPTPLLHQHPQLLPQIANHLRILLFFLVDLLNLPPVDEHDVSQEIVHNNAVVLLWLDDPLDLMEKFKHQNEAILTGGHDVLATRTDDDAGGLADVDIFAIHYDWSLKTTKHDQFASIQCQKQTFFLADAQLGHGHHLSIQLVLAQTISIAIVFLQIFLTIQ
jgi:hypothetical protein